MSGATVLIADDDETLREALCDTLELAGYGVAALEGIPWTSWAALLYMAVLPAVVGYLIYFWALGHAPASKIATMQYMQPPLATGLSALFLGEPVSSMLLGAGTLILTGVILAERAKA